MSTAAAFPARRLRGPELARSDPPAEARGRAGDADADLRQVHRASRSSAASASPSATRCAASCCPRCRARRSPRVKIEGALHEFTTLPDVVEDVTDIILNLKEVRGAGERQQAAHAAPREGRRGPGHRRRHPAGRRRRGAEPRPRAVQLLARAPSCAWSWTVGTGRGYVPAERNKTANTPVGMIPIDALFSPIRKVNFKVTNARVGQQTDYDKLTPRGLDQRHGPARRRGRLRRQDPQGPADHLHQLRRGARAGRRAPVSRGAAEAQREPVELGRRARAVGPLGQLPAERQHQATSASWCRRPSPRC